MGVGPPRGIVTHLAVRVASPRLIHGTEIAGGSAVRRCRDSSCKTLLGVRTTHAWHPRDVDRSGHSPAAQRRRDSHP